MAVLKMVAGVVVLIGVVGALIQFIPYGRDHTNPPVVQEPAWDTPQTRQLAVRACFDCHSNQTTWPWYSNVAPLSWMVYTNVVEGRSTLNFSEWNRPQHEPGSTAEVVSEGSMPPWDYQLMHPNARLSASESQAFVTGLTATFGGNIGARSR